MEQTIIELTWWVQFIEIPIISAIIWLIFKFRSEADQKIDDYAAMLQAGLAQAREGLAAYKLDVAMHYATARDLREVESRLVIHLSRIEQKLDSQAYRASRIASSLSATPIQE